MGGLPTMLSLLMGGLPPLLSLLMGGLPPLSSLLMGGLPPLSSLLMGYIQNIARRLYTSLYVLNYTLQGIWCFSFIYCMLAAELYSIGHKKRAGQKKRAVFQTSAVYLK